MTGDRAIRLGTAAVVLAVAAFAAVVSYSHIYDLGRAHGQSGTAARLLPLSVDGLIVAAGLVLLHAARQQAARRSWRAACCGSGSRPRSAPTWRTVPRSASLGAVISAWPAVAFVGAAEMALGMVRAALIDAALPVPPHAVEGHPAMTPAGPPDPLHPATGTPHPKAHPTPPGCTPPSWPPGSCRASAVSAARCTSARTAASRCRRTSPHSPAPRTGPAPGYPPRAARGRSPPQWRTPS